MFKIFVAGFCTETNSFSPSPTDRSLFERGDLLEGMKIPDTLRDTNTTISGFYEYFQDYPEVELVPGLAARASTASGTLVDDVLEEMVESIVTHLERAMPVDGVLLSLHGGCISDKKEDCEGYILERIRILVGEEVPIVSSLDLHTILTQSMVDASDALLSFRTYPHVDFKETGIRTARCLHKLVKNPVRVLKIFKKIPLIVPVENCETENGPMSGAIRKLAGMDEEADVLAASLCCPHPWADVGVMGISIALFIADRTEDSASRADFYANQAQEILDYIWHVKEEFFLRFPDISEALENLDRYEKPVILVDSGDITSAGAMGDSTVVLRAILERKVPLKVALALVDQKTVQKAAEMGEGNTGRFSVGGGVEPGYNQRIDVEAQVMKVRDDPVKVTGLSLSGISLNMGKRVLLRIGEGISLIVSEYSSLLHDPEVLRSLGVQPEKQDIIVQKSHKLFRAAYKEIAKSVVILDTPGFTDQNLRRLPYKKVRRPIYPLDNFK